MIDHLCSESLEEGSQSVEVDVFDASIRPMQVVVRDGRMVGEGIVADARLSRRVPVLHRVFDSLWIPVGLWDAKGTDFGVVVAEVLRDSDDLPGPIVLGPGYRS
jgi:hypothetical protein